MTPTEQDKELREKLTIMYFNVLTKGTTLEDVSKIGAPILKNGEEFIDELLQLITADRKRVALETEMNAWKQVRKSYPKKQTLQGRAVSWLMLADVDRKITELKAQQEALIAQSNEQGSLTIRGYENPELLKQVNA